jgi:hypothetical protein
MISGVVWGLLIAELVLAASIFLANLIITSIVQLWRSRQSATPDRNAETTPEPDQPAEAPRQEGSFSAKPLPASLDSNAVRDFQDTVQIRRKKRIRAIFLGAIAVWLAVAVCAGLLTFGSEIKAALGIDREALEKKQIEEAFRKLMDDAKKKK